MDRRTTNGKRIDYKLRRLYFVVNIYCEVIDREMIEVGRLIANNQKVTVKINSPTETMEVNYEKVSEVQEPECQESTKVQ